MFCNLIEYFTGKEVVIVKPDVPQHLDEHLTVKEKKKMVKEYLGNHGICCVDIESEAAILIIYDAYFHNIFIDSDNEEVCTHYGFYYLINKDYENMKNCWLRGIAQNSISSLLNLATYYYLETEEQDNITKYLSLASAAGDISAMSRLSFYYSKIGEHGNALTYFLLAFNEILLKKEGYGLKHWREDEYDLKHWTKRFLTFEVLFNDDRFAKQIVKLLNKLISKNSFDGNIIKIIKIIDIKYFDNSNLLLLSYKKMLDNQINLIDLHFNYAPTGQGCADAKEDFLSRL